MTNIIDGTYFLRVSHMEEIINVPMIISQHENALYGACSPKNPWFSSLTFERGVPLPGKDYHGAEATLAGYVKEGTSVAYIPKDKDLQPPWYGRNFIHTTDSPTEFVPQFPYVDTKNPIFYHLMKDGVDAIMYMLGCNRTWASCYWKYDNIYVDKTSSPPVTDDIVEFCKKQWGTDPFVVKVK